MFSDITLEKVDILQEIEEKTRGKSEQFEQCD